MLKAIIVDDDRNVCQGLSKLIPWQKLGYELVGTASNGEDGHLLALEKEPDVIISDIVMPVVDGTDFLQRIMDTMSNATFIFISAYENFSTAQLAMQKNVCAYIMKPITRQKLDSISECLLTIRYRSESREFFRKILFSAEIEAHIWHLLENRNLPAIQELFEQITHQAVILTDSSGILQDACMKMYIILCRYLQENMPQLYQAQSQRITASDIQRMKVKSDLILAITELYREVLSQPSIPQQPAEPSVCESIRQYIDTHYNDTSLDCVLLSRLFHYSAGYLSRRFSQEYHTSLSGYILSVRLRAACQMLANGDKKIDSIAKAAGFLNANYFAKAFRREMGMPPSKYRLLHVQKKLR